MDGNDVAERRRRRAAERAGWPVRVTTLADADEDDLEATTTMRERLAMVWRLTVDSWASSGRPMPSYTREESPGRLTTLRDE